MKNIIVKILTIVILFAGCTKDLDLEPQDTITDAAFWKTPDDFKLAANNLYPCLAELNFSDTESDIAFNVNNTISNGTYQTSETSDEWNNAYIYIRRSNNLIEKANASSIYDSIRKYEAEALFFRAYNYWRLLRLFGGVPKITKVLDLDSPELYQPKASRGEIADLIISDLTLAAANLPIRSELEPSDVGRITKSSADALRARVALFEGTWIKFRDGENANKYLDIAIEAANTVIISGQHLLYTGKGANSYRYLFIEEGDDSEETIFDRRYQKDIAGQVQPALIQRIGYLPNKKMADMYLCNDGLPISESPQFQGYDTQVSEYQNRDPRMTMTMMLPGSTTLQPSYASGVQSWPFYPQRNPNTGYMLYKYMSENVFANSQGESPNFSFDNHIIRYAEVLLIFAEAKFEKDGVISDGDLNSSLNLVRQRVGMVNLTNAFVSSNNLDMREEIRRERTVELAFENFRYDDLRRWKTAETEMPMAIKGIKVKGSNWTDPIVIQGSNRNPYAAASWQENTDADGFIIAESANGRYFDPSKHYLRPLPTKEILLNPNLVQNPGW